MSNQNTHYFQKNLLEGCFKVSKNNSLSNKPLVGLHKDLKVVFIDQEKWFRSPQTSLSSPIVINLKQDPFEPMIHARGYDEWAENRSWVFRPAGLMVANFVKSFKDFPPSQESMSFELGNLNEMIKPANN